MASSTRRHRRVSNLLLWLLSMPATLLTFAGFAGSWYWMLDLASHFRLQYAVVLAAITAALFLTNRWKLGTVCAIALILNLAVIIPLYWPLKQTLPIRQSASNETTHGIYPDTSTTLTLLFFNVNSANTNYDTVAQYLMESNADIIVVSETNDAWARALKRGLPTSVVVAEQIREDNFGMMMIVSPFLRLKHRWESAQTLEMVAGLQTPAIEAQLNWPEHAPPPPPASPTSPTSPSTSSASSASSTSSTSSSDVQASTTSTTPAATATSLTPIRLLAIHTLPPVRPNYAFLRDQQMQAAADWIHENDTPAIIIGDFNATPWSSAFRNMLERGSLQNSQVGYGIAGTWPAHGGPLGMIPIDHCLHTSHWTVLDRRLGPNLGSDHRPLFIQLALRPTE